MPNHKWPSVTCTTPTYGRFCRLRDAIACFLLQDYPGYRCLAISNDAAIPLNLTPDGDILAIGDRTMVVLRNWPERFVNLGRKRQQMVDAVETDLIAHWDDDDLYLPWHLSSRIKRLIDRPDIDCVKPVMAWWVEGPPDKFSRVRWQRKGYDGQMVFRTGTNAEYVDGTRSVPVSLIRDYVDRRKMWRREIPTWDTTYVYRVNDGMRHLCRTSRSHGRSKKMFGKTNRDFGQCESLLPSDNFLQWARGQTRDQFRQLIEAWITLDRVNDEDLAILSGHLLAALGDQSCLGETK